MRLLLFLSKTKQKIGGEIMAKLFRKIFKMNVNNKISKNEIVPL